MHCIGWKGIGSKIIMKLLPLECWWSGPPTMGNTGVQSFRTRWFCSQTCNSRAGCMREPSRLLAGVNRIRWNQVKKSGEIRWNQVKVQHISPAIAKWAAWGSPRNTIVVVPTLTSGPVLHCTLDGNRISVLKCPLVLLGKLLISSCFVGKFFRCLLFCSFLLSSSAAHFFFRSLFKHYWLNKLWKR